MEQTVINPQATDTKTPPLVLEYQPVERRRFRLTGWDWSLVAAALGLVMFPAFSCACAIGAVKGKAESWLSLALMTRLLVGFVLRERSYWWILYLGLSCAVPWIVDAMARYAGVLH